MSLDCSCFGDLAACACKSSEAWNGSLLPSTVSPNHVKGIETGVGIMSDCSHSIITPDVHRNCALATWASYWETDRAQGRRSEDRFKPLVPRNSTGA